MRISLIKYAGCEAYQRKLAPIGESLYLEPPVQLRDLDQDTTDWVYLVPMELVSDPIWGECRVKLARAGRYYIVCGQNLNTEKIISYVRDGAFDVLDLSDTTERWLNALHEASGSQGLWWQLYGGYNLKKDEDLIGRSPAMQSLKQSTRIIGPTNASVLVLGESGAGKERIAQAIHQASRKGSFIAVNCAAIPKDLIESELFGVEKGAYTGAVKAKKGLIQEADGGTLFLDEIGELDFTLQPKLLRFLETKKARRLGSNDEYSVDLRVISATNRDLEAEISKNNFRADLYYRLSEVILNIPPLRARTEDIPLLAQAFLKMSGERFGKNFESIEPELITRFQQYEWPGNIRELKQAVDRLVILNNGHVLRASWWDAPGKTSDPNALMPTPSQTFDGGQQVSAAPWNAGPADMGHQGRELAPVPQESAVSKWPAQDMGGGVQRPMNRREKYDMAKRLLEQSDYDYTWVAARMGVHPTTLYRWRQKNKV